MVFDPATLPGKVLWLRAKDNAGADGSAITTWADQTGLANGTAAGTSPTVAAASTPLGGKSVRFDGAGWFTLPQLTMAASSMLGSDYSPIYITDGNAATAWHSAANVPQWISVGLTTAYAATSYTMTPRNSDEDRNPKDFVFQGSNDKLNWTTLDTRTGQITWGVTPRTFSFSNTTAYLHYRIYISAVNGIYTQLAELAIPGATFLPQECGEIWAVIKVDTTSGRNNGPWRFGLSGSSGSFYPLTDGNLWDCFGTTSQVSMGSPVASVTSWRIYRIASTDTSWFATLDGISQFSGAAQPRGWSTAPVIGAGNGGYYFLGNMAEILVRSQVSTAQEVTDITAYLTAEHFVAAAPTLGTATTADDVALAATLSATLGLAGSTGSDVTLAADLTVTPSVTPVALGAASTADDATLAASLTLAAHTALDAATADDVTLAANLTVTVFGTVALGTASTGSDVALAATLNTDLRHLLPWTADVSQRLLLEIVLADTELAITPPIVAGSGTDGLPPTGALALPSGTITSGAVTTSWSVTERVIMRHSVSVPAMTPGTDHRVRVTSPVYDGTYPTVDAVVGVAHVIIGGVDVTYLRGTPVGIGADRAEQPFGDVTLTIDLPQITPQDTPGTGSLAWLKPGSRVELVILNGTALTRLWCGHLVSDDGGNDERAPRTAWTASGTLWQASTFGHRVPTIMAPADIGTIIARSLNKVIGRVYPVLPIVHTGILTTQRGSSADSELAYVQTLLATAWTPSTQWTVAKVPGTSRTYTLRGKDLVTVNHTITTGARGVDLNLSRDMTSTANALFGRGIGTNGLAWAGWCWPNFLADTAPAYPYASGATVMTVGSTDSGTLTGDGVSAWQRRVNELNLTGNVAVDGVFNTSDASVCRAIQSDYGLSVDGIVGPQTWAATFDVGGNGGDLSGAYRRPLAIDPTCEPYLFSASGAVTGPNPAYTAAMRYERDTDYGPGVSKAEATQSAIRELARDKNPGLTGTIVLTEDPREGSRFLITPGQNLRLLGYGGGNPLLHIADVTRDWQALSVTLTVDEHARDSITLAAIRGRIKAAQADPARRPGRTDRRSRQVNDTVVPFDSESSAGIIPRHAVFGGLWTVIRVPLSEVGDIAKIAVRTQSPAAKFSMWLFAGPVTPADLVRLVGDPLAGTNPTARTAAKGDALDDLGLIEAFGGPGSAAGYGYGAEGADPITGWLKDTKGFHYNSVAGGWIWVAEWSPVPTFISGKIDPGPIQ